MKKQAFNPYLPSYEYIPDGEPRIFEDRLYVYGSHDRFNSEKFCMNDYVCWSAPLDDLADWRYEGVIYKKNQDPDNADETYELWAPDITQGPDGRYYLYYCLANDYRKLGVAVCDGPCGQFEFYGHVHFKDGTPFGQREGDPVPFDPGIFIDDDGKIYLYSGNSALFPSDTKYKESVVMQLEKDMVTIIGEPKKLLPSRKDSQGTGFEGHEFFEASSIRKINGKYYFIYSSVQMHELCYAVSDRPDEGFQYMGTLISNGDIGLHGDVCVDLSSGPDKRVMNYLGNNHGSIVEINGEWFVFYHRHTNRHWFSRQGCAERLVMNPDGSFQQAEMTSCGLNRGPLKGKGIYEARIACNLMSKEGAMFCHLRKAQNTGYVAQNHPAFTQEGEDREDNPNQYIDNMRDGAVAGFKYFDFSGASRISVTVRGGGKGRFIVRDGLEGNVVAEIPTAQAKEWSDFDAPLHISDGVHPLFFTYEGEGAVDFLCFEIS